MGYAEAAGLPFDMGVIRNHYVGRTFIEPSDAIRNMGVRLKHNANKDVLAGKRVVLVDDSIVRGTTSRQIVKLARACGARKVLFASTSPPLIHPCVYGIDMSTRREFVARGRSHADVARQIEADGVIYQDLDDLVDSVREGHPGIEQMCTACFSGNYPTGDVTPQMLLQIEQERLVNSK